ncbi:MAG: glycosyltransferase family 2 protein [Rikenellaceae bacterium]
MDISVIIPIWNVENYIERCLRSIFEQTKTEGVEFILVNDCTPDGSMEVARRVIAEYPNLTVRIIEHPENRNNGAARQTGLEAAIGDYTMQVDSDDWCEPRMLEELYAKAIETDADIVYCNYYFNEILEELPVHQTGFDMCKFYLEGSRLPGSALWNKLIKRNLFTQYNVAINHGGMRRSIDKYTTIRLFYFADKVVHLPSAYYHYYYNVNPNSVTNTHYFREIVALHNLIENFCIDNNCNFSQEVFLKKKALLKLCWLRNIRSSVKQRECIPYFPEVDRLY